MNISELFDSNLLEEMFSAKYITKREHATEDLYIYNYTPITQYSNTWNEVTKNCRGLVTDSKGEILARPFQKFFNIQEHIRNLDDVCKKMAEEPPALCMEKYDGMLGILYWVGDIPFITTRGSFNSLGGFYGSMILQTACTDYSVFDKNKTYLFEIIHPELQIVIDYGGEEKLVLLGVFDIETGKREEVKNLPFEYAKVYDLDTIKQLKIEKGQEGYVFELKDGTRVKLKSKEYVEIQKFQMRFSYKDVLQNLQNKKSIDDILAKAPDELFEIIREMNNKMISLYHNIKITEMEIANMGNKCKTHKERALFINNNSKHTGIAFAIAKNKSIYEELIWEEVGRQYKQLITK